MRKIFILFIAVALTNFAFAQTNIKNISTNKLPGSNCDNLVHNTLPPDASNRSPSDCEIQFDWKVRNALLAAFRKTFQDFPSSDWIIQDTAITQLTQVSKESENYFFGLSYYFQADLLPQSTSGSLWAQKSGDLLNNWVKNPTEASYKSYLSAMYEMNNAVHVKFYILVNDVGHPIIFLKGNEQKLTVPGASYAVKGQHVGALTGGGEENWMDACLILFGKSKLSTEKDNKGITGVYVENNFPKNVSKLTVQNISIRIECNDELLNKILNNTNWKAIADLVGQ